MRKGVMVVAVGLGLAACSADVLDMTGDAMIAVGDAMQRPDAEARDIPATCEPNMIEREVTLPDGSRSVSVLSYAEARPEHPCVVREVA